jgi:general secretion pathway protein F
MRFRYAALTPDGQPVSGVLEVPSAAAAVEQLQLQGLFPIDAVESSPGAIPIAQGSFLRGHTLPEADLALITRQMSRLIEAGLPLDRALLIIGGLMRKSSSRKIVEAVHAGVCDGDSLADAMASRPGAFPAAVLAMVRAGEQGGIIAPVLGRAAEFLARDQAVRQRIVSALIYPAILATVASLAITIVLTLVLPEFEPIFAESHARLPRITQIVMAGGRSFREAWWLIPPLGLASVLAWRLLIRRPSIQWIVARALLETPVIGPLVLRNDSARFARTLSALLANGVPSERALGLASDVVQNSVLISALNEATERLRGGEGLSGPLQRTGKLPDLLIKLVQVGEESGKLPELLAEAAGVLEAEAERDIDRLLALLVPVLTIGMGGVIATIIAAVLLAMLSINDIAG